MRYTMVVQCTFCFLYWCSRSLDIATTKSDFSAREDMDECKANNNKWIIVPI